MIQMLIKRIARRQCDLAVQQLQVIDNISFLGFTFQVSEENSKDREFWRSKGKAGVIDMHGSLEKNLKSSGVLL
jgi:hypothetical protein